MRWWKFGVEGHRERDCRVGESEGAGGGWSGGQYETGKNRGGVKQESVIFGVEKERDRERGAGTRKNRSYRIQDAEVIFAG